VARAAVASSEGLFLSSQPLVVIIVPMLRDRIKADLKEKIEEVFGVDVSEIHLEHPQNPKFGDYATNVALTLSPSLKQSPLEIAKRVGYYKMSRKRVASSTSRRLRRWPRVLLI